MSHVLWRRTQSFVWWLLCLLPPYSSHFTLLQNIINNIFSASIGPDKHFHIQLPKWNSVRWWILMFFVTCCGHRFTEFQKISSHNVLRIIIIIRGRNPLQKRRISIWWFSFCVTKLHRTCTFRLLGPLKSHLSQRRKWSGSPSGAKKNLRSTHPKFRSGRILWNLIFWSRQKIIKNIYQKISWNDLECSTLDPESMIFFDPVIVVFRMTDVGRNIPYSL